MMLQIKLVPAGAAAHPKVPKIQPAELPQVAAQ
jgi:hypothetical protein